MKQASYELDDFRRQVVLAALLEVCGHRRWALLAAHVRTRHVHVVVQANQRPEFVINTIKAYASRALNRLGLEGDGRRRWARHGSTRHLWTARAVSAAVHYVICDQGEPMASFEAPSAR
jgi:hypothetical protein